MRRFWFDMLHVFLIPLKSSSSILSSPSSFTSWFEFCDCWFFAFFDRSSLPILMKNFSFDLVIFNNYMLDCLGLLVIRLLWKDWEVIFHVSKSSVRWCDLRRNCHFTNQLWLWLFDALLFTFENLEVLTCILFQSLFNFRHASTSFFVSLFIIIKTFRRWHALGFLFDDILLFRRIQGFEEVFGKVWISHGYVSFYIINAI